MILPPYLYPSRVELEKVDSVALFQPQFGFATTQRIDYGATRWRAVLVFEKLRDSDRHELLSFLHSVGRVKSFYVPAYGHAQRGGGTFTELLTNNTFESGVGSWVSGASYTITVSGRVARCTRNTVGSGAAAIRTGVLTTAVSGFPHVFSADLVPGKASFDTLLLQMGSTAGGSEYGTLAIPAGTYGLFTLVTDPSSSNLSVTVQDNDTAGQTVGDYFEVPWLSSSRCGRVNGASQTGSALNTDGWAISTNGLLVAGDFVNIVLPNAGRYLVRLTAALNTNSSGEGYLQFEPPLPESPADNAGVIVNAPLFKCVVPEVPRVLTSGPGFQSDFEMIAEGVF